MQTMQPCSAQAESQGQLDRGVRDTMIVIGIVLLLLGFVFGIHLLWILGIVALVVGLLLLIAGAAGREVGGRKHWY
jgi:uncharacterized membrane protein HdeD (DUF308 family)